MAPKHLPDVSGAVILLLFLVFCAALPCAVYTSAVTKAAIFQDMEGNLHINSTANRTVFINGVNTIAENMAQQTEIATLKSKVAALEAAGPGGLPSLGVLGSTYYGTVSGCNMDRFVNVTQVVGEITITGCGPGANLSGLAGIKFVQGNIDISTNSFTNVDFSSLTSVGGGLRIHNNALTNVDSFASLTSVGGFMSISNNDALANVDGFLSLTLVGGYLNFWYNAALKNVDGFSSLASVGGFLRIHNINRLTNVDGFSSLTLVGGFFHIYEGNGALTNVDGFSSLTSVGGYMILEGNDALTTVDGFSSLTSVDGDYIKICQNTQLSSIPSFFTTLSAGKSHSSQCLRTGDRCC